MKTLIALSFLLPFATVVAVASPVESKRVLKDTTTYVPLELTAQTVFCTDRGYGNVQLKVSVPDLDWLAHFDHRVVGETLPCMTGGACTAALTPGSIIKPGERVTVVPVRVVLIEHTLIDRTARSCKQLLEEQIVSNVRGRKFTHSKSDPDYKVADFEKCDKIVPASRE
jgi:hypothetical protein